MDRDDREHPGLQSPGQAPGNEAPARGVQELIARIRDQGVRAAEEEAERILADARARARALVEEARDEAAELRARTRAALETDRAASIESLRLAARDAALELRGRLQDAFRRSVRRLVTQELSDPDLVRELVLELAGEVRRAVGDRPVRLLLPVPRSGSQDAPDPLAELAHGIAAGMLREGVELVPSSELRAGARVVLAGDDVVLDLSDRAVSELFLEHLLPRFAGMLRDLP